MSRIVEVRTGARLHFGLFDSKSGSGRLGGIGMMIDRPGLVLQAWRSTRDKVLGPPHVLDRIPELVARVRLGLDDPSSHPSAEPPSSPISIRVSEMIPPHRGFGSGTQLAYAVTTAVESVLGVKPLLTPDLGRGGRSAVGTVGFHRGGFLIDAGLRHRTKLDAGITRRKVPPEWRFVVIDPQGSAGPSGTAEAAGFRLLPPMPRHMPDLLFDLVADVILPGLDDRDFHRFARGITEFNRLVGEHFAPAQGGGIYAHPVIREVARTLAQTSWPHLAQSSWGPAAVVFCDSEASAEALKMFLKRRFSLEEPEVFVAAARNRGADVSVDESA